MLGWEQIKREAHQHLGAVELLPPWLRLQVLDAQGQPVMPIAMRHSELLGAEAILIAGFICPAAGMRMSMALALNDRIDGGLVVVHGEYTLRLVLPAAVLSWEALQRAIDHVVLSVQFVRSEVARTEAILNDRFLHYCD